MNIETVEKVMVSGNRENSVGGRVAKINSKMPKPLIDNGDGFTRLKLKINNLLWEELPGHVCLTRAEEIACEIMTILIDELPDTVEE